MPKRTDIKKILIIGSGPIVIGQACEFDYSGTQACKALREEGYEVVLVNSNPATIMTDPEMADRTYIEPLTARVRRRKIIERERPDALLPTLGGQTGLNLAVALAEDGVLERYGVELIGAKLEAIKKAEDRELFKRGHGAHRPRAAALGLRALARGGARDASATIGYPADHPPVVHPGRHRRRDRLQPRGARGRGHAGGCSRARSSEVLVEESVIGWKEFELEVMRDRKDNVVIICSIENFDPMGVHTGDSITVAPAQTLTDKEYQLMRDAAIAIIREIGVETGGSNIQFAVNPADGRMVVIEMNPRVCRSSALASKATGFPIAKIAAKLAVGYTLDEMRNDITRETPASFEPTIDYCVVKIPRWAFEKFPEADPTLTTQMKSVGEVMAIGRTFKEALQKAIRSLEQDRWGLDARTAPSPTSTSCGRQLRVPNAERLLRRRRGAPPRARAPRRSTGSRRIDPWFLENIRRDRRVRAGDPRRAGLGDPDVAAAGQAAGLLRPAPRRARRHAPRPRSGRPRLAARHPRHLQDGGHLRRRVRGPHALPLLDLRGRGRGAAHRRARRW